MPEPGYREVGLRYNRSAALAALLASVAIGLALRLLHFRGDRSAWIDEAAVLDSLFHRSFLGLLAPLAHLQMAPYGWLWAERLAIAIAGPTVLAARWVPLLSGLAALLLFAWLSWRRLALRPWEAVLAVFAFAVLEPLVYFSGEVRQYGTDVLAAICALAIYLWLHRTQHWSARQVVALVAFGAVIVWFSHPVVLVLAAIGTALALERLLRRDKRAFFVLVAVAAIWLASFGAFYLLSISDPAAAFKRSYAFPGRYAPLPPRSQADLLWYYNALGWLFDGLGFALPGLAALFLIAGAIELARRDNWLAVAALLPLPLVLTASALHLYPFWGRLLLFLAPGLLIAIAAGAGAVFDGGRRLRPVAVAGTLLLVAYPAAQTLFHALRHPPYARQEIKPLMSRISEDAPAGGTVFVAFGAELAWKIYAPQFPALDKLHVVFGEEPSRMTDLSYARLMHDLAQSGQAYALFITDPITRWNWGDVDEDRAFDIFASLAGAEGRTLLATDGGLLRRYRFGATPALLQLPETAAAPISKTVR